jgi:hypothetical protein
VDAPRLAADLTVLDVVLSLTAPRIERDGDRLAAVRTRHLAFYVGGAIAEREVSLEVEVIGLRIKGKPHIET